MTSEWHEVPLRELVGYISKGIAPSYAEEASESTIRVLNQKCNRNFRISYGDSRLHDTRKKKVPPERYVKPDDILINSTGAGTAGRIAQIEDVPSATTIDGHMILIRSNGKVTQKFLGYALKAHQWEVLQLDEGSTGQTELNRDRLLDEIMINYPVSLDEQNAIVGTLESIDRKLIVNEQLNDNLEQQVMALYHQMFDESNSNRKNIRADEYFDISIGKTPPRKEPQWFSKNPSDCVWVSISDMGSCGLYIEDSSEYLTHDAVEKFNVKIVPDNTVILSFKLTVGRVAITDGCMTTNEAIAHFKTDKPKINEYLYCYLKNFNFQTMGSTSSIATAVNSKIIKGMPFVVPTAEELEKFHSIAAPLFTMIKSNQQESKYLGELRDALLPKLMSGEIDVSGIQL